MPDMGNREEQPVNPRIGVDDGAFAVVRMARPVGIGVIGGACIAIDVVADVVRNAAQIAQIGKAVDLMPELPRQQRQRQRRESAGLSTALTG